jgi:hypothetical protein
MALSFGFDSKIVNSPFYNLCYSLPFVCAFYLMNIKPEINPFGDFLVTGDIALFFILIGAAFYYMAFVLFAALGSHISGFIEDSNWWLVYVVMIFILAWYSFFANESQPKVAIYFGLLSLIILATVLFKKHNSDVSHLVTVVFGSIASLVCFTSGVLWYFDFYIFQESVAAAFGLTSVKPESLKVGAAMLFSLGYVIYYGTFKLNEITEPHIPNK